MCKPSAGGEVQKEDELSESNNRKQCDCSLDARSPPAWKGSFASAEKNAGDVLSCTISPFSLEV